MGKKNKKQKAPTLSSKPAIASGAVCKVVDDLWTLLQPNSSDHLGTLLNEYDNIQSILRRLHDLQGHPEPTCRENNLPTFEKWLQSHGVNYQDKVEITKTDDHGFGMRVVRDIKIEEKVLEIPERLMMTSQTALHGELGDLIQKDNMLQSMPNVALALHLLNEKYSPSSFWRPYIDVLPQSFSLPLYFTKKELLLLNGSPCLVKCLLQIRNITKLYSHLYRMIKILGQESLQLFKSGFLYDDFIWAVSCVMSRQNEIPSKPGLPSPTLALIPLWDFCNHCSGTITTFYNVENSTCDCYAHRSFSAHEEFTIFYGSRTNAELLLQQGFVYPENEHDTYQIRLGLSSMEDEVTKSMRKQLLECLNLPISGSYHLGKQDNPFTTDLCAFTRIFTADHSTLELLLAEKLQLESKLKSTKWEPNDKKALDFLEKRCCLLVRAYKSSIDEDETQLKSESLIPCYRQAILLTLCEKRILINAIDCIKKVMP